MCRGSPLSRASSLSTSLFLSQQPPLTTASLPGRLLPFRRPTPFCFSLALRRDGEDGSHRLRSTATPQARLVLLLLYLAGLQWRRYSGFSRRFRSESAVPREMQTRSWNNHGRKDDTDPLAGGWRIRYPNEGPDGRITVVLSDLNFYLHVPVSGSRGDIHIVFATATELFIGALEYSPSLES